MRTDGGGRVMLVSKPAPVALRLPAEVAAQMRQSPATLRRHATGRPRCRACGVRVGDGELCLVGVYAFPDNYGWSTLVWLHINPCEEERACQQDQP